MSIFQEQSSLFALLQARAGGAPAVDPLGPERSTSFDVGVEQGFADGRARVRASYFHNAFEDLIEFVSKAMLPLVGVPPAVAAATAFGAYVNSSVVRRAGPRDLGRGGAGRRLRLMASYTYLDAEVTESFSGGVLAPAINPAFPGIPIGQFSPLVGERPFRRPAHSGSFMVSYPNGPFDVALSAYLLGQARRQHVPERRLLRLLAAAAEPGPRGGLSEGGSRRRATASHRSCGCSPASRTCSTRTTRRPTGSPRCRSPRASA